MVLYIGDIFAAFAPTFRLKIPKGDDMKSVLSLKLMICVSLLTRC